MTRCKSLVWRTPSLTVFHDGRRRISTVTSEPPRVPARRCLAPTGTGVNGRRVMLRSVGGQLIRLSVAPSSHRAYTSGFRSWAVIRGLIGEAEYFDAAVSDTDKIQELLEFVAWCASEGNQAGTIASKLSAVLHFHRINVQIELPTSSPLIKSALKGVARSHAAAGTPKRVRRPISWNHC